MHNLIAGKPKPLMLLSSHCWMHNFIADKSKPLMLLSSVNQGRRPHTKSPSCKLSSHQATTQSHQAANYQAIKLLLIYYQATKLQIIKSSSYHYIQSHQAANYKAIKLSLINYTLYKAIKLQIKSSSYHLYNYQAIKLQITKPSSYHLYIIKPSSYHYTIYTYHEYPVSDCWVFFCSASL